MDFDSDIKKTFLSRGYNGIIMAEKKDGEVFESYVLFNAIPILDIVGENAKHDNMVLAYHGTKKNFSKFDLSKAGSATDSGMFGKGFYFTDDESYARTYAGKDGIVISAYLDIKNPLVIRSTDDIPKISVPDATIKDLRNAPDAYSEKFREWLIRNDYDGVYDLMSAKKQYVVLYPEQVHIVD